MSTSQVLYDPLEEKVLKREPEIIKTLVNKLSETLGNSINIDFVKIIREDKELK